MSLAQVLDAWFQILRPALAHGKQRKASQVRGPLPPSWDTRVEFLSLSLALPGWRHFCHSSFQTNTCCFLKKKKKKKETQFPRIVKRWLAPGSTIVTSGSRSLSFHGLLVHATLFSVHLLSLPRILLAGASTRISGVPWATQTSITYQQPRLQCPATPITDTLSL